MDDLPVSGSTGHGNFRTGPEHSPVLPLILEGRPQIAVERRCAKGITFAQEHRTIASLTQPRSVRQHGIEHRLQFTMRAGDDLQHVTRRDLLFERFAQLPLKSVYSCT